MTAELFPTSLVPPAPARGLSRSPLPGLKAVLSAAPAGRLLARPLGLVGLLLGQSARARRGARPPAFVTVSCLRPDGTPAVRVRLP